MLFKFSFHKEDSHYFSVFPKILAFLEVLVLDFLYTGFFQIFKNVYRETTIQRGITFQKSKVP